MPTLFSSSMFSSSIGRKLVMAVTGVALVGFVLVHLLGNLQIFLGAEKFNANAHTLAEIPELIWPARIGLLALFLLHIYVALQLRGANSHARPVGYREMQTVQATAASLYMLETGIVILLFVILHLAHFTFGWLQPEYFGVPYKNGGKDVYAMVVNGFHSIPYVMVYVLCMVLLGIHLSHGISSTVQTLGFNGPVLTRRAQTASRALAALIALGYISIPFSILAGIISLPAGS